MHFIILECIGGRTREIILITPQSYIIHNLCLRLKYKWAKETLNWKKKAGNDLRVCDLKLTAKNSEAVGNVEDVTECKEMDQPEKMMISGKALQNFIIRQVCQS
jgi:hypothetical protein